jgi:hypothetical protein
MTIMHQKIGSWLFSPCKKETKYWSKTIKNKICNLIVANAVLQKPLHSKSHTELIHGYKLTALYDCAMTANLTGRAMTLAITRLTTEPHVRSQIRQCGP